MKIGNHYKRDSLPPRELVDKHLPAHHQLTPIGNGVKQASEPSTPGWELEHFYNSPGTHWLRAALGALIPSTPVVSHTWGRAAYVA